MVPWESCLGQATHPGHRFRAPGATIDAWQLLHGWGLHPNKPSVHEHRGLGCTEGDPLYFTVLLQNFFSFKLSGSLSLWADWACNRLRTIGKKTRISKVLSASLREHYSCFTHNHSCQLPPELAIFFLGQKWRMEKLTSRKHAFPKKTKAGATTREYF